VSLPLATVPANLALSEKDKDLKMRAAHQNLAISIHLIILLFPVSSIAAGQAALGREIAVKWCSSCHLVEDTQNTSSADLPTFGFIANKYRGAIEVLGAFLADPHPPMPNLSLTRREIQDLMAYIGSIE
jgi:mono/diheme cytochrome c family protein